MLSKLWPVKQKLTCVQLFDMTKSLYMFRTLPDVPTGANLTATILATMIDKLDLRKVTDLWINVDGAGDNVNYTLYYVLAHFLLKTKEQGWSLKRFHILRMKVGHTHCDLDATFAALSKFVYGKHSRGDARKNILSLSSFKEVIYMHTYTHADRQYITHMQRTHMHTDTQQSHTCNSRARNAHTHTHTHTHKHI